MSLSPNSLAFVALSNEYCSMMEGAGEVADRRSFVNEMLRLLPRLYITAADLKPNPSLDEDEAYLDNYLDEDYYESIRSAVEDLLGAEDVYLEVFEEDMKYSDTPIRASVAEGLCDIFQELYNFISVVRDAPESRINDALIAVRDDFASFWSQKVVNLMRPLNQIKYSDSEEDDNDDMTDEDLI